MKYNGLTNKEVEDRISKGLVNVVENNISKSKKDIILEHTFTYFNFLNIFLATVIIYSGHIKNITFLGVVFTNSIIGIYQELKVKKIIDKLEVVTVRKVKVIRDGLLQEIPIDKLVIDDVIFVESGNQVGSDCIVLSSQGMEVNESLLTGESDAIKKQENDEILAGSYLIAGSGYGKVIRVGNDNYATSLTNKAKHKSRASSEMKDSIEKIIKILSIVIIPVGFLLFISQVKFVNQPVDQAIVRSVAGIIGMIPEGLVLLTSLSFVIGVGKLAKKNALIQEMEAIEALARIDVLCLDKTGTITTGDLKIEMVEPIESNINEINKIMGCISHYFDDVNVTQKALQDYFKEEKLEVIDSIPFSSKRKYRAIKTNSMCYLLGAPEYLIEDRVILDKVDNYSRQGCRVLLLGSSNNMDCSSTIKALALIVIKDCIRDDAKDILRYFRRNDVDIKILSGDNPITVSQVSLEVGLENGDKYIDASKLPTNENELNKVIDNYTVFGRVKPEQKHSIIKAMQANGHIVGMVGDGVNDVLALKDANCGIALAGGSEASRQAAHVVLLDSDFASMKNIVEEGRNIIANIERVSSLYLTKTIYSSILSIVFVFMGSTYPFTPLQLSLISSLTIGIPSFYLTLESNARMDHDGFLHHVVRTALPCALTMVIYILLIRFLGTILNFDSVMYSTYYFLMAGFISFLVDWIVCMPLERKRSLVIITLMVIFFITLFFFHDFFNINHIISIGLIWLLPLCGSAPFVLQAIKYIIHRINAFVSNHIH